MSTAIAEWIRPWYPAGPIGHVLPDCEELLHHVAEPREGSGWLDPRQGEVCVDCLRRHDPGLYKAIFEAPSWDAECSTCDSSMSEEWEEEDKPFTADDANRWKREHECEPSVKIIPPNSEGTTP